jgi:tripartite-type tricarboxylate transporter receptor subunit TctC
MKKLSMIAIAVAVLAFTAAVARAADEFPSKPIQLIVPYGAGGLTDLAARMVAERMGKILRSSILVVNKAGAGTSIGAGYVAASSPDGHTILINMTGGAVVTPMIMSNLSYKMSDLKPIGKMMSAVYLVLASRDLPVKTLPELIAYAKKNPDKFSYASPGVGTVNHLALEQLNVQNQLGMQHIPYTSELQVINAVMGNHVQAGAVTVPFSLKFIQGNQVKALAILGESRDTLLPEVSTSAEQGFPELIASIYNVMFAPAKTPAPILKQLEDALRTALQDPELVSSLEKMQFKIDFLNSADTERFLDNEVKKWAAVIKRANITAK